MPLIWLVLAAVMFAGCSERGPGNASVSSYQSVKPGDSQQVMTSVAKGAPVLKTADQLYNTYMSLTGLNVQTLGQFYPTVTTTYNTLESQLPGSNDVGGYSAGAQVAINKLAAVFCNSLVERAFTANAPALATPIFGTLSLGGTASSQLGTDAQRRALATAVLARFWGSPLQEKLPPRESAVADLASVLGEIYAASTSEQGTSVLTRNMAKAACTAVLASLPVTLQ